MKSFVRREMAASYLTCVCVFWFAVRSGVEILYSLGTGYLSGNDDSTFKLRLRFERYLCCCGRQQKCELLNRVTPLHWPKLVYETFCSSLWRKASRVWNDSGALFKGKVSSGDQTGGYLSELRWIKCVGKSVEKSSTWRTNFPKSSQMNFERKWRDFSNGHFYRLRVLSIFNRFNQFSGVV